MRGCSLTARQRATGPSERPAREGPVVGLYAIRRQSDCGREEGLRAQALRVHEFLSRTSTDCVGHGSLELVVPDHGTEIRSILRGATEGVHAGAASDVPEDDRALTAVRDRAPVRVEVARSGRRYRAAADVLPARRLAERDVRLEERLRVRLP